MNCSTDSSNLCNRTTAWTSSVHSSSSSVSSGWAAYRSSSTTVSAPSTSPHRLAEVASSSSSSVASSVVQSVVLVVISFPAVVGNILTCLVVHRSRRLQSTTNYFVISLALADLLLSLLAMPFVLGQAVTRRWIFAPFLCRCVRFVQFLAPGSTSFVFVSICVDRFYTILHPLSFAVTRSRARQMILAAWGAAAALASPAFFVFHVRSSSSSSSSSADDGRSFCAQYVVDSNPRTIGYVAVVTFLALVLPVIVCFFFYVRISRFIWRVGFGGRPFQRTTNPVPRAKVKMVKMLIALNATSVVLMAPFVVVQMIRSCLPYPEDDYFDALYIVVVCVYFSSAASKPIQYVCLNSNFRRGCKEMFCMSMMKCYRSHVYTITTMSALAKKNHVGVVDRPMGGITADPVSGGGGSGGGAWISVSPEFQYQGTAEDDSSKARKAAMYADRAENTSAKYVWVGPGEGSPSTYV